MAYTYINRVWDTVKGGPVTWQTSAEDSTGTSYPGPGVFGVDTSGYCIAAVVASADELWPAMATATLDLSQAENTYDALTASGGDILIEGIGFYVGTAGATFTSVSVQTNQTSALTILTASEGAVANLTAQKTLAFAYSRFPFVLKDGQKIQYTIAGLTGTGSVTMAVVYRPLVRGESATLV